MKPRESNMAGSPQINISNKSWERHVLSSLCRLRRANVLCDTQLVTDDGLTCQAHVILLAASSPVMYKLLMTGGSQPSPSTQHGRTVKVPQVAEQSVLQHILDFIYEGQITVPIARLCKVQKAADKLQIRQLSDVCKTILDEMGNKNSDSNFQSTPCDTVLDLAAHKHDSPLNAQTNPLLDKSMQADCVLKVPMVKVDMAEESFTDDEAMDLTVVKTENTHTSDIPSLCDKNLENTAEVQVIHSLDQPEDIRSPASETKPFEELCNYASQLHDDNDKKDALSNQSGMEDMDLVAEMVAEQLVQSKMQRMMGKQDKGTKRFQCRICESRFTRLDNLRVHIRSIHTGCKPFKCNLCDKTFTRAFTLKYHKMSHDGIKPWTCPDCGRGFTRKDYHQDHIRNQICKRNGRRSRTSSPVEEAHQCQLCDRYFPSQESLESHMESCNDDSMEAASSHDGGMLYGNLSMEDGMMAAKVSSPEQAERARSPDMVPLSPERRDHLCEVCHTHFMDHDSLEVHQWEHRRQEESQLVEMVAPDAPDSSPTKYYGKQEAVFDATRDESLDDSLPTHAVSSPITTQEEAQSQDRRHSSSLRELLCDEEYNSQHGRQVKADLKHQFNPLDLSKSSLQSDENENVMGELSLQRNGYDFSLFNLGRKATNSSRNELKENKISKRLFEHMCLENAMPHDGAICEERQGKRSKQERPYTCDICQARFTRGDNMRVHRRRHFNAAKMFSCLMCGQSFTRSSSLKTHMGAAHKVE